MDKCKHCGLRIEMAGFNGERMLWNGGELGTICPVNIAGHCPEDRGVKGGLPPAELYQRVAGLAKAARRIKREQR